MGSRDPYEGLGGSFQVGGAIQFLPKRRNKSVDLGGVQSYDAAASALFAAMTTPPTELRKQQINTLIVALKASGAWSLIDCLYVLAAADNQAARLNWKNPALFTASAINSPTFTVDRGYASDGSTSLLDSGFNPATAGGSYALNSAHLAIWDRVDASLTASPPVGNLNATVQNKAGLTSSALSRVNAGGTTTNTGLPTSAMMHYVANRNNGANHDLWGGGTKIAAAVASASTAISSLSFTMLARQISAGSYQFSQSGRQMSAYHWGAALSDAQITGAYNALLAYMQAVGAA